MNIAEESKLRDEASRGLRAQALIDDELLREAFQMLRTRYTNEWAESPARDSEGREKLWLMLKLLSAVDAHLSEVLTTGKLAATQLEQERTRLQRTKDWMKEVLS
jgi:hypothetical protein